MTSNKLFANFTGSVAFALLVGFVFFAVEALVNRRLQGNRREWALDAYYIVVGALAGTLFFWLGIQLASFLHAFGHVSPHDRLLGPGPSWPSVIALFFLAEFLAYWLHRAAHAVPWLWRYHSVHHAVTELYSFNGLRFHLGNQILNKTRVFVLVGAGWPFVEIAAVGGLGMWTMVYLHTRLRFLPSWIGVILFTPGLHRFHHDRTADVRATNYGSLLTVFDRAFGTFRTGTAAEIEALQLGVDSPSSRAR